MLDVTSLGIPPTSSLDKTMVDAKLGGQGAITQSAKVIVFNEDRKPSHRPRPKQGASARDWLGRTLKGRYRVEKCLGEGSLGSLYRVTKLDDGKPYAAKLLKESFASNPLFVSRFTQEATIAASVKHPGIAEVYDVGIEAGVPYFVTELFEEGGTLAAYLEQSGILGQEEAVDIVCAVAEAIGAAHARDVVHRDLRPENIFLIPRQSGPPQVKVVDFGLSKSVPTGDLNETGGQTITHWVSPRPEFMSPELCAGEPADPRSDIYSLAVILYQALAGARPFESPHATEIVSMHLTKPPPPLSSKCPDLAVSSRLEAAIMKALSKRPEDRYGSMRELADALRRSLVEKAPAKVKTEARRFRGGAPFSLPVKLLVSAGVVVAFGILVILLARMLAQSSSLQTPLRPGKTVAPASAGVTKAGPQAAMNAHADNAKPGPQVVSDSRPRNPDPLDVPAEPPDAIPLAPSIYQDPRDRPLDRDSNVGPGTTSRSR